jgi:hypothetical protein
MAPAITRSVGVGMIASVKDGVSEMRSHCLGVFQVGRSNIGYCQLDNERDTVISFN